MESLNDNIRIYIKDTVTEYSMKCHVPLEEAVTFFAMDLYSLFGKNDKKTKIYKIMFYSTVYLDAYKIYSFGFKNCALSNTSYWSYYDIKMIKTYDELVDAIENNPMFFKTLINASLDFYFMSFAIKMIHIKSLSDEENELLSFIAPIHEIDIKTYDKEIEVVNLLEEYILYQFEEKSKYSIEEDKIGKEAVIGFIKQYASLDKEGIYKLLKEIVDDDKESIIYLRNLGIEEDKFYKRLAIYNSHDEVECFKIILKDDDLLNELVNMLIDRFIEQKYENISFEDYNKTKLLK